MPKLHAVLSFALLTVAAACGGDSEGSPGGTSAGAGAGGAAAGAGGAAAGAAGVSAGGASAGAAGASTGACNTLVNDGGDIPEKAETGAPPAMTGGAVADGTYVLTGRSDWMGSCNCTSRQKLQIAGETAHGVARTDAKADVHYTAKAALSGNTLTLTMSCPASQVITLQYTATATTLSIFDPKDQSLDVYTKQ